MGPDTSRWRSSSTYDYVDNLFAPDLAWEWLRRNNSYQRDYARGERSTSDADRLMTLVRRRWGLTFPDRSIARRYRHHSILGAGSRSRYSHPRLYGGTAGYPRVAFC
jgi:hypothetical protein